MLTRLFLILSLLSLCFFLYGILFIIIDNTGENACKMTYMFEYPQFVRIHFKANRPFLKYGLYAYSEGYLTERARSMVFTGAPVIFVPGNGGSYKQARSLASVALRKGLENKWSNHLDYFTISYNEEYSGLFGGYLEDQKDFLKISIKTVLNLYKNLQNAPRQVVLIGHSMGGKIAQSMLTDPEISSFVNTVVTLAAPIDRPVLNMDFYFEAFYRKTNNYLEKNMKEIIVSNETNYCRITAHSDQNFSDEQTSSLLKDVIVISLGGEKKDLLVNSGLTHSKYSDIHALATSVPNVWLSMDHLCAVWCLQLVLVINRFLYSILYIPKGKMNYNSGQSFITDKSTKLIKARHYFVKPFRYIRSREVNLVARTSDFDHWIEESRRVYSEKYEYGLNDTRTYMIRLMDLPQYKMLSVEAINLDAEDWVFGCAANEIRGDMRYCSKATSLSHLAKNLPSAKYKRQCLYIDLHKLKRSHPTWTHVVLRLFPTREMLQIKVDIHEPAARQIMTKIPKWYSFSKVNLLNDTITGSSFYQLKITDLEETHQSILFEIVPRVCSKAEHHAVIGICVPWARGSRRYHYITHDQNELLYIYTPEPKPFDYNTTENPIVVNMHLDPSCRYTMSIKNSFGGTMSRLVQQFFHWLPAHITAVLLLALKHQVSITPKNAQFKCGKLHSALLSCSSFFLITAARVFAKLLSSFDSAPIPDNFNHSMMISIIIHGSAVGLLSLATGGLWIAITFCGNAVHMLLIRLLNLPLPTISSVVVPVIQKFPISAGVLLISIANASCGGICIICACAVYFILMTKQYEDYLEEFVYKTAKMIAKKLFGSQKPARANSVQEREGVNAENANSEEITIKPQSECDESSTPKEGICEKADNENEDSVENVEEVPAANNEDKPENELTEEEKREEAELDVLLKQALESQRKPVKDECENRKEYDSIHEGLSSLHFHMTMFLLLVVLAIINVPCTISWAKNFSYSPIISSDPSLFPAIVTLASSSIIWQFSTPRNVYGYPVIASILYICAAISLVYCQDSIYRLNAVISTVFAFIAIHQMCAPMKRVEDNQDSEEEWKDKIQKYKAMFKEDPQALSENLVS